MDTFNLFAKPSEIEGIARFFDFGNTLQQYNTSETGEKADAKAIRSDWIVVGNDIQETIEMYEQETNK